MHAVVRLDKVKVEMMIRQMLSTVSSGSSLMAGDEGPHHVGLAARPERQAAALPRLGFDEPMDDLAALHQQLVKRRVDAIVSIRRSARVSRRKAWS